MSGIESNKDQFRALADNPGQEPFVMLNLLKFKKEGGRESYFRYIRESGPFVEAVGAKVLYFGKPKELLQGSEDWDLLMLVSYPSRKAFLTMANNPDYLKVHEFRAQGVERAVLYATDPVKFREILSE
ncbi:MAG: DUF1330 domain-containing protein [Smithellaceae bacterium]|nr:DUF1330 domain-containing protein [Smithellaceae bacterium]MDD3259363.1 DUF1330 domain-containing protein [Smithellaceae bacterium]MDD3849437.1 DUF1330 domain-containing protein [Smithellaceae bacterium]HOG12727.1 DUF1330 domain-containing protein [Smithellaceae bacterium]HOQ72167.1 DUF1330 domain-containing protein [Smithellaceae bacterium]